MRHLFFLATTLITLSAKADYLDDCKQHLINQSNISGTAAADACREADANGTTRDVLQFIYCHGMLTSSDGGLDGLNAAQYCLQNSTYRFIKCHLNGYAVTKNAIHSALVCLRSF